MGMSWLVPSGFCCLKTKQLKKEKKKKTFCFEIAADFQVEITW